MDTIVTILGTLLSLVLKLAELFIGFFIQAVRLVLEFIQSIFGFVM